MRVCSMLDWTEEMFLLLEPSASLPTLWPLPNVLLSAQVYLQWTVRYMHMFSLYNQTCKPQVPRVQHLANHGQSAVVMTTCYWQARFSKGLGSAVHCAYFEVNVIIYPKT